MKMRNAVRWAVVLFVLSVSVLAAGEVKYLFLFIGDGMSIPQRMMAEEFGTRTGYGQLCFNHFPVHALTRTCSASSLITDSAASGTAIACGEKTANGRIGMDAAGQRKLFSMAELAHQKGKRVGIVTTTPITHATPASFYAHRPHRSQYYAIGLDLIASGFEYFAGGGFFHKSDDRKAPEYRGDLYRLAAKAGYKVVDSRAGLLALKPGCGKILARGAEDWMPFAVDCRTDVPTLAEFTAKGIELLDNPQGFFMMIESGTIDWCGHANDAAGNLHEVLALDKAVRRALAFAAKHPDQTLIVVTGDHETGGMTMGFAGCGDTIHVENLAYQKCSIEQFKKRLDDARKTNKNFSFDEAKKMLRADFGFVFSGDGPMRVTPQEQRALEQAFRSRRLPDAARRLISAKAGIGWTSGNHTALPVLTTATGHQAEILTGFLDNTDIAKRLKQLLQ